MPSNFNYQKDTQSLLAKLTPRQNEIICRRFALQGGEAQTLEQIGRDLGLTRERVRQVVASSLARMAEKPWSPTIQSFFAGLQGYFKKNGGCKREDSLLNESWLNHQENSRRWLFFLLTLENGFVRGPESKEVFAFWAQGPAAIRKVFQIQPRLTTVLEKEKKILSLAEISRGTAEKDKIFLKSALEISRKVREVDRQRYGLMDWPEVNPRGVRDLAWLVLRQAQTPLHFREISGRIDSLLLGNFSSVLASAGSAPAKRTNQQTVHNELIKNPQFILVGRGTYALREWGYQPGTVKDVIRGALEQAKTPLPEKEILKKVLSQRLVKESTVLLNLGDKRYFLKSTDGRYSLREA